MRVLMPLLVLLAPCASAQGFLSQPRPAFKRSVAATAFDARMTQQAAQNWVAPAISDLINAVVAGCGHTFVRAKPVDARALHSMKWQNDELRVGFSHDVRRHSARETMAAIASDCRGASCRARARHGSMTRKCSWSGTAARNSRATRPKSPSTFRSATARACSPSTGCRSSARRRWSTVSQVAGRHGRLHVRRITYASSSRQSNARRSRMRSHDALWTCCSCFLRHPRHREAF